jgi:hypothetical protein
MENNKNQSSITAPRLIPTFVLGFNSIANHIYLILFPLALDILLWLGPLIRIKNLVQPVIERTIQDMSSVYPSETIQMMQASKDVILQFFERFNILFALRTFPIGVPSLILGIAPLDNPLGHLSINEVSSFSIAFILVIVFLLMGLIIGCIYFSLIALAADGEPLSIDFMQFLNQIKNSLVYFVLVLLLGIGLSLPVMCLSSSIAAFLPSLGVIPFFIIGLILVWLLLPLVFSPHGIFAGQQTAIGSIGTSIRMVRKYLPGTGLFFLIAILLSQGLDMLWATPAENDWLILVGILGHAFISSGVLAASFVYYSKGIVYMQEMMRKETARKAMPGSITQ